MNIFLEETELTEISPLTPSEDKALVINPTVGIRGEAISDIQKEITAIDALDIGPSRAAVINGVPQSSASKYKDGKDISNLDSRARVLSIKNEIHDVAITKLMDTLQLLNPEDAESPREKIAIITGLSKLVDDVSSKDRDGDKPQVHLHLYGPNQKKESDYEVIDV